MKATEQYFPVVLFITLRKVLLIFESYNEILKCNHSDVTIQMKATEQYFPLVLFIALYRAVLPSFGDSVDKPLRCDHSNKTSLAVLLYSAICFYVIKKLNL